jgi:hypothetical protein
MLNFVFKRHQFISWNQNTIELSSKKHDTNIQRGAFHTTKPFANEIMPYVKLRGFICDFYGYKQQIENSQRQRQCKEILALISLDWSWWKLYTYT